MTRIEKASMPPSRRRVLVALDTLSRHSDLLEPAVALASVLGAELDALFIEDERLLRAVGLRSSREVVRVSAAERQTSTDEMSRALRRLAASLQAQIEAMAQQAGVVSRFEIVRGHRYLTVYQARDTCDIIVAGRRDSAWPPRSSIGVLRLLLAPTDAGRRALDVTVALALRYRADVELLLPVTEEPGLRRSVAALAERLSSEDLGLRVRRCAGARCAELLAARPQAGRLVVLPADFEGIGTADGLREWIDRLAGPLIMVK
jgi:nucleotide-binding universal stress UspA family protein